jgi:hypothetical protein
MSITPSCYSTCFADSTIIIISSPSSRGGSCPTTESRQLFLLCDKVSSYSCSSVSLSISSHMFISASRISLQSSNAIHSPVLCFLFHVLLFSGSTSTSFFLNTSKSACIPLIQVPTGVSLTVNPIPSYPPSPRYRVPRSICGVNDQVVDDEATILGGREEGERVRVGSTAVVDCGYFRG